MINQDRMIFADFSVNSELISIKFRKDYFLVNPNSGENFTKLYLIFQTLDYFTLIKF